MFDIVAFIPRMVAQSIPLMLGSTGETITQKSGNLNLGIPGVMYVGAISGVIGSFLYEHSCGGSAEAMNPFLTIAIPLFCCLLGSFLMGLLYCILTVTLRANQNVTGLAMTTFGVGFGNFFGGSLIKLTGSDIPSIALSANCREAVLFLWFSCLRRDHYFPGCRLCDTKHQSRAAPSRGGRESRDC